MFKSMSGIQKTGLFIVTSILLISVFAPLLAPHDPHKLGIPYQRPSGSHILGTNDVGQDIFSELIYGSRISLLVGMTAAAVSTFAGVILGLSAGYFGGITDRIITQIINIAMAVPSLPITIVLAAYLDASIWNIIIAICITSWVSAARIIRTRTKQICAMPFVMIEKTLSAGSFHIMFRHILPNFAEVVFIRGILAVSGAMLTEASLSFLGLGVFNQKSWGGILHYAFFRNGILNGYYWWYVPPILCISLSVLGFMLIGYYPNEESSASSQRSPKGGHSHAADL